MISVSLLYPSLAAHVAPAALARRHMLVRVRAAAWPPAVARLRLTPLLVVATFHSRPRGDGAKPRALGLEPTLDAPDHAFGLAQDRQLVRGAGDDAGLDLNMFKTQILVKNVTVEAAWTSAQGFISADPHLTPLKDMITSSSFTADGYVGVGVPLGTDAFVQKFVYEKCLQVIGDVAKLDPIADGFVHYQLIRFCQATRLQYLNSHVSLDNQLVLQQQHVDHMIGEALLKKGTDNTHLTWPTNHRAWVDMVLHLPHEHGGFGITSNAIARKAAFYTTTARFIAFVGSLPSANQQLWIPDDLTTHSSIPSDWVSPPLLTFSTLF